MRIFLSTADASGDLHASALVAALRRHRPDLDVYGLGGDRLRSEGFASVVDQSRLAIAGLVEVLSSAPRVVRAYTQLRRSLLHPRPDVALFVDSPDLNLPLAAVARRSGIRTLYYVAPQVWAWRSGRTKTLRRRIDRVGVIFPFEEPLLRSAGIDATFLGHPLVDRMASFRAEFDRAAAARELGLDPDRPVLALLPGSRHNEVDHNLEPMLEAARLVGHAVPGLQVVLPVAPTLESQPLEVPEPVRLVRGLTYEVMALATCALSAPGTATLEAALLEVPTVITHTVHALSFAVAQHVVRVGSSSMLNLIAGRAVVPEHLQAMARPAAIAARLAHWIRCPEAREGARKDLRKAVAHLGPPGAVERAAEWVLESVPGG